MPALSRNDVATYLAHAKLSPGVRRVLDTLLAVSPPDGPPRADQATLLVELERREMTTIAPAAFRKRLSRTNAALAGASFSLVSGQGEVVATPTAVRDAEVATDAVEAHIEAREASSLRLDVSSLVRPRAAPGELWVMYSYSHQTSKGEQQAQIEFAEALKEQLKLPSPEDVDLPPIELWREVRARLRDLA